MYAIIFMKILIYALGGGLGHIVRAYKLSLFLKYQYPNNQILVLASYQNIPDFLSKNLTIQWIYPENIQEISRRILSIIQKFQPDCWITDVFANGLFYELPFLLNAFNFFKVVTVRTLNIETCKIFSEVHYDESWQIEWLPNYMNNYIKNLASKNLEIRLPMLQDYHRTIQGKKYIIHTGNQEEIRFLKNQHPHFDIVNPYVFFPLPVFKDCELVTGAGCNIFQDLCYIAENHYIYAFNRKYDNQCLRLQNSINVKKWYSNG